MEFDARSFGKRLKHIRTAHHLTQEELAEQIDTAASSISHLENGTHSPSLKTLINLCNTLDIGIDDLMADSLPVKSIHLDRDIADLLSDCTTGEKQIIKEIIISTKSALRNQR